ncbi:tubulin-like doman-containing protein [Intestinibacter bartlettii]|uniref:Tubulin-like doman-containing protein n=1 Tax=Intestinibacter bartlettii TaxID=261299 RepID=A0ABS6DZY2_9FIRM|nr:tubulin-like doman-containing protein [Intestinibacter bartlettii]MBU5337094.1 tubulin-like doman-containing protein [Intestinibacter bartlettii]
MAFDINANKKILKRLSLVEGGGFVNFASNINRAKTVNDKILIIGSGGIGGKAVTRLKSEIYKKFEIPEGKEKPDNIEFLYLDSDRDELERSCNKDINGIGLNSEDTCQIYSPAAGGIFKHYDWYDKLKDHQKDWYNPTLSPTLSGNGAGGIRQASRYLLTSDGAFGNIVNNIERKINLMMEDGLILGSKIRVFIVAGIGGGTGSGSFMDLAYIVREVINQKGYNEVFKLYGYLFLPDVYEVGGAGKFKIMENGYAALKELDYFMNIEDMEDAGFNMKYSSNFEVTNPKTNVFDTCILITGSRDGVGAIVHSEENAISTVSDFIIDIITSTEMVDGKFMIESFLDNQTHVDVALDQMENTPMNANFKYMVIGSSSIILPFEQVTCYLGYKTMDRIKKLWDKEPSASEITSLMNKLGVSPQRQYNEMYSRAQDRYTMPSTTKDFTKDDVLNGEVDRKVKQEIMCQNEKVFTAYDNIRQEIVTQILREYSLYEKESMKDIDKGPNYLFMAIHGFVKNGQEPINGLITRIEKDLKTEVQQYINGCTSSIQSMEERKQKIKDGMGGRFSMGSGKKIGEYLDLCYQIEMTRNGKVYIYQKINETLDEVVGHLENRVYNYLQGYRETMDEIMKILKENYDIITDPEKTQKSFPNSLVDLSKADENNMRLKRILDHEIEQKKDAELIDSFSDVILNNVDEWTSMEFNVYNPGKSLVAFIEKTYDSIVSKSVEEFLQDYMDKGFDQAVTEICKQLKADSDVCYKTQLDFNLDSLVSNKSVAVPRNAVEFRKKINALDNSTVYDSSDKNKINWIKCYLGVPLYSMSNIEAYEKSYKKTKGVHLNEHNDNYAELPSIHNKKYYSASYVNEDESKICEEISENIDTMIEEELIYKENGEYFARVLYGFTNDEDELNKQIEGFTKQYISDEANKENGQYKLKLNMLEAFANYIGLQISKKFIKPKNSHLTNTVEDLKLATRMSWHLYKNMRATLELYNKVKAEVEKYNEKIMGEIKAQTQAQEEASQFEKDIRLFKKCLDTSLILREANFWRYYINLDEKFTFANYMTFEKIDRDYEMFTCFKKFIGAVQPNQRAVLERLYEHKINDPNLEVGNAIMKKRDEVESDAQTKVSKLNSFEVEMDFLGKGLDDLRKEMINFYKTILEL